jgi:DUF1680 family protein
MRTLFVIPALFFPVMFFPMLFVHAADYPVAPVPFTDVRVTGGFWQEKQETNRMVTLPFAIRQCEESGRVKNFELAAEVMRRRAGGEPDFQIKPPTIFVFDDTDVYKTIEGAAYVLSMRRDAEMERKLDGWIAKVAAAQEPDGYLYTFRTMHPDSPGHKWIGRKRWELDPGLSHELYNAGHLYEAGAAYFQATGKRALLDVCLKNAELLWRDFGDDKPAVAPGHQIVEMGLVKLYRLTNDGRWLTLAKKFLDARGPRGPAYNQRHRPVADQDEATGHAVRANYMYSGMADVAALTGDRRYEEAIGKIWRNVVEKKLYLTGGVGALRHGEAYGGDYDLPDDGYNETCAAVAFMQWNHRMFLLTGDAKYMDVFERTAFNGFLSGVSVSGDHFFYTNPLVYNGTAKNNAGMAGRAPWFGCACCPPNLMRTLASMSGCFYATRDSSLYVNFYSESEARFAFAGTNVRLSQKTVYPWDGAVRLEVAPDAAVRFALRLRIPGWAQGRPLPSDLYSYEKPGDASWEVRLNGGPVRASVDDRGYVSIERKWQPSDVVELCFAMPVQRVRQNALLSLLQDRVAFERGPVVYCFEEDRPASFLGDMAVPEGATINAQFKKDLLGGVGTLNIAGMQSPQKDAQGADALVAIPYYSWANRGLKPMIVWVRNTSSAGVAKN